MTVWQNICPCIWGIGYEETGNGCRQNRARQMDLDEVHGMKWACDKDNIGVPNLSLMVQQIGDSLCPTKGILQTMTQKCLPPEGNGP